MLYHFLYPLSKLFTFLNVFGYITVRSIFAFIITFLICLFAFPAFIRMLKVWKAGQVIREDGPKTHLDKVGTPTMGGLLTIIAIVISMLITGNFSNPYTLILLLCVVSFGLIGFIDDYLKISKKSSAGMSSGVKLLLQFIASVILTILIYFVLGKDMMMSVYVPFFKNLKISLSYGYIPFCIFIIIGSSNAVNITDGLDGLAGGLLIAVVATFGMLSYVTGHKEIAEYLYLDYIKQSSELLVFCFAIIGGLCGFLWYNSHPAAVFMGDTGSLSFGGVIGTMALMIKQELLLAIVGGVFVAEIGSVIIQVLSYKIRKKRVFKMAPLHHHFELKGWEESKVITRFWIIGGILAVIAIGSLKIR